jgi:hypothetical protein
VRIEIRWIGSNAAMQHMLAITALNIRFTFKTAGEKQDG